MLEKLSSANRYIYFYIVVTYIKEGEKLANITVKVPSDIVGIIGEHKNVEKESRILIATELYREGEISVGRAAELAALAFEDFIEELKYRKMKIYSLLEVSEAKDEEKIAEKYFK